MLDFTIKQQQQQQQQQQPILVTLEEGLKGQVDVILTDSGGRNFQICAIGNGKVHLFTMDTEVAKRIGLQLDANRYPLIIRV